MGDRKFSQSLGIIVVILSLCFAPLAISQTEKSLAQKSDVRLLIDISGSMKKNDPNNLRIPALQLVTNLLPKGADAGVWTFGRYVNMMVPLSKVDAHWQNQATQSAKKINSRGLYTNIGSVLEKASYGWTSPNSHEKRSFLLLTDGMVDISKDPAVNKKERSRILNVILPKLKRAGVSIHTIALSENADHELLKQLSTQTDGWYQEVNNAEELQKVFLKIFEQAAQRDALPIVDNQFPVDESIEEMTVLVFKQPGSKATKLISPSDKTFDSSTADPSIRWFATDGYDLITVEKPQTGNWKIDAKVDPDNRVMVVSKLGLSINALPNNLLAGEAIDYQLQLLEEGKPIKNKDFLSLVDAILEQDKNGQKSKLAMFYDSANQTFKQSFFTDSFEGELKLTLKVTSPTFERVRSHAINIYGSPIDAEIMISEDNLKPHQLKITTKDDLVDKASLKINLTITQPSGEKKFHVIEQADTITDIAADIKGGHYRIDFKISGKSLLGRHFTVTPESLEFDAKGLPQTEPEPKPEEIVEHADIAEQPVQEDSKQDPVEQSKPVESKPEESKTVEPKPLESKAEASKPEESKPEESKPEESIPEQQVEQGLFGISWIYIGLGANLILAILGFIVWRVIKKRSSKAASAVADELRIDDDDDDEDGEDNEDGVDEDKVNEDEDEDEDEDEQADVSKDKKNE